MAQLPSQSQFGDYGEWPGRDVLDSGGERLGGVREIYLDRETGRPEWVLVDVDSDEARFVPLADASVESSTIRVAHTADAIRKAPGIGAEPRIDQSEERRLYAHYGLGYVEGDSGSGPPPEETASTSASVRSDADGLGRAGRSPDDGATPTGWGAAKTEEDATSPWGTEEDKPAPFVAGETPDPWGTPAKAEAPSDPWGKPKAEEPVPPVARGHRGARDVLERGRRPRADEPRAAGRTVRVHGGRADQPRSGAGRAADARGARRGRHPGTVDRRRPRPPTTPRPRRRAAPTEGVTPPADDPVAPDDVVAPSSAGEILARGRGRPDRAARTGHGAPRHAALAAADPFRATPGGRAGRHRGRRPRRSQGDDRRGARDRPGPALRASPPALTIRCSTALKLRAVEP